MVRSPKPICGVGKVALRNAPYGEGDRTISTTMALWVSAARGNQGWVSYRCLNPTYAIRDRTSKAEQLF
jgi:hypothetical protein